MGNIFVDPSARVGVPIRMLQGFRQSQIAVEHSQPKFDGDGYIGPFALIGEGVSFGNRVIVDAYCSIGRGARIDDDTLITHRATVGGFAHIGRDCVIGGLVGEESIVEDGSRVFGKLVHAQDDPTESWDHRLVSEPSPRIRERSFIGFDAIVVGGVTVGPTSYVAAGAVVSQDVPPRHVAFGTNRIVPIAEWTGRLRDSPMFSSE